MLRRNFLKFLGLLPLGLVAGGHLPKNSGFIPVNLDYVPYYAQIRLNPSISDFKQSNRKMEFTWGCDKYANTVEVELASGEKPEIEEVAYVGKFGLVHCTIKLPTVTTVFPIGVFVSKAYNKLSMNVIS